MKITTARKQLNNTLDFFIKKRQEFLFEFEDYKYWEYQKLVEIARRQKFSLIETFKIESKNKFRNNKIVFINYLEPEA